MTTQGRQKISYKVQCSHITQYKYLTHHNRVLQHGQWHLIKHFDRHKGNRKRYALEQQEGSGFMSQTDDEWKEDRAREEDESGEDQWKERNTIIQARILIQG